MFCLLAMLAIAVLPLAACGQAGQQHTAGTFAMDALVNQSAYGKNAQTAMQQINVELAALDARLSLYAEGSDIARINAAAGGAPVDISADTADLLTRAKALTAHSEGAFALTVAPLTLAWGVLSENPRVVPPAERPALQALVNDDKLHVEGTTARLEEAGMGIDLGGIGKGEACNLARRVFEEYGVESALFNMAGSTIYARGTKPGGEAYRIGFRDPASPGNAYIASFPLQDEFVAVSGGYERFFTQNGTRYIHIMDPRTAAPAESDIVSVGVLCEDGAEADFYSTTLFVWGRERSLQYMREGGKAILLDGEGTLYVSEALREGFKLYEECEGQYHIEYVGGASTL